MRWPAPTTCGADRWPGSCWPAGGPRHLLLFSAHHLVFDGISKELLVRELADAYSAGPGRRR